MNQNFDLIEFSQDELEKLLNDSTLQHESKQHLNVIAASCKPPTPASTPGSTPKSVISRSPAGVPLLENNTTYDFTTIKYVTSYYLLEEEKYGVQKIIIFSKHELNEVYDPPELCSESQAHYHYVIRFDKVYYETCTREKKPLFPELLEVKVAPINNIDQYNNCIGFIISLKKNIHSRFMKNVNSPARTVAKKRKHEEASSTGSVEEVLSNKSTSCEINLKLADEKEIKSNEDIGEITVEQLNILKESAKRSNSVKLMEDYFKCLDKSNRQQETKKTFNEIIEKEKPMSEYEYEVLRYDYDMRMSVFRACHVLDLIDARNQIQSRSDHCPIYVLVGGKSCGKSKIALHVANTIGQCTFPLVAYTHADQHVIAEWYETGSNVLVFEDFDFREATDPLEPYRIITNLKKWASGQDIYFLDPSKCNKHSHPHRTRKMKAIFLTINKCDEQTMQFFQSIPENMIEFEFLRFGPEYSYSPEINSRYLNLYPDSCTICSKSMYKFLKHYQKCKLDSTLNSGPRGFSSQNNSRRPAKYPYSTELYTIDYKYAFMCI